eukprot:scaffold2324_cov116-Cylindrotheca_fusiformis.AAC.14
MRVCPYVNIGFSTNCQTIDDGETTLTPHSIQKCHRSWGLPLGQEWVLVINPTVAHSRRASGVFCLHSGRVNEKSAMTLSIGSSFYLKFTTNEMS